MKNIFLSLTVVFLLLFSASIASCRNYGDDNSAELSLTDISAEVSEISLPQELTLTEQQIELWRDETENRISQIKASPNMEIPKNSTVYYVSNDGDDANDGLSPEKPWQTLDKVNNASIAWGDYVCFERGGLWRGQLVPKMGITYTAYGIGEKPKLYGSAFNAASAELWEESDVQNIWVLQAGQNDVGTLVFNEGEAHAIKCIIRTENDGTTYNNTTGRPFNTYGDLDADLHFWHDYKDSGKLYLYSEQNPAVRFDSIELCAKGNVVAINDRVGNVTIDNLCIKYTGSHGIGASVYEYLTVMNLTVSNCEIGWIGGSIQSGVSYDRNYDTRYGNAVEIWGGCDGFTVTDNYIYQVYDAAITQQYNEKKNREVRQVDILYARNVIENINYSIEYWLRFNPNYGVADKGKIDNFVIEDNYMWYAGKGYCEQRPDKQTASHIKSWSSGCVPNNCYIRNNLMFGTEHEFIEINPNLPNADGSVAYPYFENNSLAGDSDDYFGIVGFSRNRLKKFTTVAECLGEFSHNDKFWFE